MDFVSARRAALSIAAAAWVAAMPVWSSPAAADIWVFDQQHTEVRFSWDHLGLVRQSAEFLAVDGRLDFTPTDPENGSIDVTIKVAGLSSGVKALDNDLKGPDFFDMARHPTITFKSTAVRRTGDKTGTVEGDLTIMGITRPTVLKVIWTFTGEHPFAQINPTYAGKWVSGFSATALVRRSDWGLKRAVPLISDDIQVQIDAEFLRAE